MKKIFEMIKLNKKSKGSFVVEATLIFPLIMFIMFGIIYLTIVHYQNNVMIAESIRAMNRAGAYWQYIDMDKYGKYDSVDFTTPPFDSNMKKEGIINIEMIKNRNAYRTIIDILAEAGSKIFNIPIGAKKAFAKFCIGLIYALPISMFKSSPKNINPPPFTSSIVVKSLFCGLYCLN